MSFQNARPKTMVEKIISSKAARPVKAGQILPVAIDYAMATDGSAPMAIDFFKQIKGKVKYPERILLIQDHYVPCPNDKVAALLKKMEKFSSDHNIKLYGEGEGICHRLLPEQGYVSPGSIVVGADSHSTTYGAINAFGTGIGSSDFAGAMYTGKIWLKVPESINITLKGQLPANVYAKDLALFLVGSLGSDGATYCSLEFTGSAIANLSMESRFTLCNMVVETGGKNGIMPCDKVCKEWIKNNSHLNDNVISDGVTADQEAEYKFNKTIDLAKLEPQLSAPHAVDNVHPVAKWSGKQLHMAVIGTCTNGSIEDLRIAADVLRHNSLAKGLRLLIIPPSRQILREAIAEGLVELFLEKGAVITSPGCGPCCGALNGVPRDGDVVISTANRNFIGRMGNINSEVFLASPLTVAVSAITGEITDPRSFLNERSR